jgi:MFS family permease
MLLRHTWQRVALAMFAVGWGANQFTPMLVVYRDELGLSAQTRALLFGVYAAGLIPGLLLGGTASDRWGRRAITVPFVALSPLATLALVLLREEAVGLGLGRLIAGVCSGVVFSAGSAWVAELSVGDAPGTGARRAAIALSAGFGTGPLVAGLVAEWAPDPLWVPYLPHLVLGAAAALLLRRAPEPAGARSGAGALIRIPAVTRSRGFVTAVAPVAPWVFGSVAIAAALLPGEVGGGSGNAVAFAAVTTGLALGTGVLIQPLARRLDDRHALSGGAAGLLFAITGIVIGILALTQDSRLLVLLAAPVFGAGYGFCLVSGLRETERLSHPDERGATVAIFYALTYLGFAAPYLLGLLASTGLDVRGALAVAAGAGCASLAILAAALRRGGRVRVVTDPV